MQRKANCPRNSKTTISILVDQKTLAELELDDFYEKQMGL